jgi:hypothetical protein
MDDCAARATLSLSLFQSSPQFPRKGWITRREEGVDSTQGTLGTISQVDSETPRDLVIGFHAFTPECKARVAEKQAGTVTGKARLG